MTFAALKLIRLPTAEGEVQELADGYLEVHRFPQYIDAIGGTHIVIVETTEHYSDFINRKGYFSLNVRPVCDYKYCFQDVVVQWPGSVHDARIFLNSSVNGMLQKTIILPCEDISRMER